MLTKCPCCKLFWLGLLGLTFRKPSRHWNLILISGSHIYPGCLATNISASVLPWLQYLAQLPFKARPPSSFHNALPHGLCSHNLAHPHSVTLFWLRAFSIPLLEQFLLSQALTSFWIRHPSPFFIFDSRIKEIFFSMSGCLSPPDG